MVHVQVGAGVIGLGALAPILSKADISTIFVRRTEEWVDYLSRISQYHVIGYQDGSECEDTTISDYSAALPEKVVLTAEQLNEPIILTEASRAKGHERFEQYLDRLVWTIKTIIAQLPTESKEIILISCANNMAIYPELRRRLAEELPRDMSRIKIYDSIIDRLMSTNLPIQVPTVDHLEIKAEPYERCSWTVGIDQPTDATLGIMRFDDHVRFVSSNSLIYLKTRELWLLNGVHFAIAVHGYLSNHTKGTDYDYIDQVLKENTIRLEIMSIQDDLRIALEYLLERDGIHENELEGLDKYNKRIMSRFQNPLEHTLLSVARNLKDKIKKQERIVGPMTILYENGKEWKRLAKILAISCYISFKEGDNDELSIYLPNGLDSIDWLLRIHCGITEGEVRSFVVGEIERLRLQEGVFDDEQEG